MAPDCTDAPSGTFLKGIREFNRHEWYECHETIEAIWLESSGELRDFYQGIIQLAIALHHWRNGNFGGSVKLLESGKAYLTKVTGRCLWVDVEALIFAADKTIAALTKLGEENMVELDCSLLPKLTTFSARVGDKN